MAAIFIRTILIYLILILTLRLSGKWQIGEMQISELVTRVVEELSYTADLHTYDQLMEADRMARETAERLLCT